MRTKYNNRINDVDKENDGYPVNEPSNSPQAELVWEGRVVNAELVNVRNSPSADPDNIAFVANEGDKFTIIDKVGGYYMVKNPRAIGNVYISRDYLKEV